MITLSSWRDLKANPVCIRFIKLRICSVGSWSVVLNRDVVNSCQFHLVTWRWNYIVGSMGIFLALASLRPFLGNIPSKSRKQLYGDRKLSLIVILYSLSVKGAFYGRGLFFGRPFNETSDLWGLSFTVNCYTLYP